MQLEKDECTCNKVSDIFNGSSGINARLTRVIGRLCFPASISLTQDVDPVLRQSGTIRYTRTYRWSPSLAAAAFSCADCAMRMHGGGSNTINESEPPRACGSPNVGCARELSSYTEHRPMMGLICEAGQS